MATHAAHRDRRGRSRLPWAGLTIAVFLAVAGTTAAQSGWLGPQRPDGPGPRPQSFTIDGAVAAARAVKPIAFIAPGDRVLYDGAVPPSTPVLRAGSRDRHVCTWIRWDARDLTRGSIRCDGRTLTHIPAGELTPVERLSP